LPNLPDLARPFGIVVTGVGGTGVVTIGALLGMAADLEGKGVSVLDMTGLAQKGGAVLSHVQIAASLDALHATRVAAGEAALVIGCDAIVSASADVLTRTRHGITRAVINSAGTPTAEFVKNREWSYPASRVQSELKNGIGDGVEFIDANEAALTLLGDTIYANPLLLGYAWQKGWLPVGRDALERAIELNGVSVEKNKLAFDWGRYLARHGAAALPRPASVAQPVVLQMPESLEKIVATRVAHLTAYQDAAYAAHYRDAVERVREKEKAVFGESRSMPLTQAVAVNLAKLMAYKDEYEVARLYADPAFLDKLRSQFDGEPGRDYRLNFYLAPPLLAKRNDNGELVKRRYGAWVLPAFRLLAPLRRLRGSWFDPFGRTAERRAERHLIDEYFALVDELCSSLSAENREAALELARLPDAIRGFGHVKEKAMEAAARRRAELLARYRAPCETLRAAG
ncbi:MAG TPA: DUF6537 domain-containing protein, partial [Noviherbaspirillum sp.]|nr:DUF6537 domain-containing protein [Noviherbaspirillum sp.]